MKTFQLQDVNCRSCNKLRLDDGTACPNCGVYQNPKVGQAQTAPAIMSAYAAGAGTR